MDYLKKADYTVGDTVAIEDEEGVFVTEIAEIDKTSSLGIGEFITQDRCCYMYCQILGVVVNK